MTEATLAPRDLPKLDITLFPNLPNKGPRDVSIIQPQKVFLSLSI